MRPICPGCAGSPGWIVPPPGPDEATRCGCNPRPATITHQLNSIGQAWLIKVMCGEDVDAWIGRDEKASSDAADVTCPACLERLKQ